MKPSIAFLLILSICFLCSCQSTQTSETHHTQQTREEVRPVAQTPSFDCNPCLVKLVPKAPEKAALSSEYTVDVDVVGLEDCSDIVITSRPVNGASFVKSVPPAEMAEGRLTWKMDYLKKGQTEKIQVWYRADQEGQKVCCFTLSAKPFYCVVTAIGKPELVIEKSGPATALVNQDVTYTIVVKNLGNATAHNVVVTDQIPEGLVHPENQRTVTFQVGELAPNDSKTYQVTAKTTQTGRFCNVATLTSSDIPSEMKAEACTEVKSQDMQLVVNCSQGEYLRSRSRNTIVLENVGQTAITNVRIVASTDPSLCSIVEPEGFANGEIAWNYDVIEAGQKVEIPFRATSAIAGNHCIQITATTGEGLSKKAECCTNWEGIPAMLLEVVDDPDPVKTEDTTTYTITVTNQGTKEDTNIIIEAVFTDEVDPIQVKGAEGTEGRISGKNVVFTAYPRLDPKQTIIYTIIGKGKAAGDARTQFFLKTDFISNRGKPPVTETESTNIY